MTTKSINATTTRLEKQAVYFSNCVAFTKLPYKEGLRKRVSKYMVSALLLTAALPLSAQDKNKPISSILEAPAASNLLPGKKAPVVTDVWVVFKTHCDLVYDVYFGLTSALYSWLDKFGSLQQHI
jgi:alpha-mannosidase